LRKKPLIICTTGLTDACTASIAAAAESIAIFQSANMSLGINVVAKLIKEASAILYKSGFDIEIIEKHHNQKVDAPSGTALFLANAMNNEGGLRYITDRSQSRQKRSREEIGISSVRGGTIVGEHNVIFAGESETIEITHTAASKDVFAAGALAAAAFIKNKPPGLYGMEHLLSDYKYHLTE
jgi:4-hydroxy-tetrahydrodipicolinate reductase